MHATRRDPQGCAVQVGSFFALGVVGRGVERITEYRATKALHGHAKLVCSACEWLEHKRTERLARWALFYRILCERLRGEESDCRVLQGAQ